MAPRVEPVAKVLILPLRRKLCRTTWFGARRTVVSPAHESPIPFGRPLRMKKYSARRVGLGARNLFRSGGGRTEVRAPVGLRRCRSEATEPYRRLGVSKSTVDSHFRANLPATNPPLTPTAVELRSADF